MAAYKVIQDIEAEDKLLGPLSLRQFIYAGIACICAYLAFLAFTKGAWPLSVAFLPFMVFTGFFAFPWGKDQPTEVWALAKIRFFLKPRRRIWDQSGIKELVTVTAPKYIERHLTNGLDQTEVTSRLRALADTIDSRGWAVKNVNVNMYAQPSAVASSDRLVEASSLPQEVTAVDVHAADDILDETANPIAQHFDDMIAASQASHHQQLVAAMQAPAGQTDDTQAPSSQPPNDYWFMHQPAPGPADQSMFATTPVIVPGSDDAGVPLLPHAAEPTADEQAMVEKFKAENENTVQLTQGHMKVVKTPEQLAAEAAARTQVEAALSKEQGRHKAAVTPVEQAAIMNLAHNDDLDVATIARQMKKPKQHGSDGGSDEVVISLR